MRLFLIGDDKSGTGPANATRDLLKQLPRNTLHLKHKGKLLRFLELLVKVPQADVCLMSGYSRQNLYTLSLAKMFHKKTAYLMHGCVEYENRINGVEDSVMTRVERKTLKESDRIIAVSRQFEGFLKKQYPQYQDKITHVTNGVDWNILKERTARAKRESMKIFSIGGGMPRKRIVRICEALEILQRRGICCTLTVAGDTGHDSDKINQFSFVEDIGLVTRKEILHQMHTSKIYIQNSCFETFGLAPLEALLCGCDLLLSDKVGALSLFQEIEPMDRIEDCENADLIANKIEYLLQHENHSRLLVELDKESTSWKARSEQLQTILKQIDEKKS